MRTSHSNYAGQFPFHSFLRGYKMQKKSFVSLKKSKGFTLIEIMIALGIIGAATAVVLGYQSMAQRNAQTKDTITAVSNMASKIKTYYAAQGTYNSISAAAINGMSLVTQPLTYDGTNIRDAGGNTVSIVGNAVGAAPSFVITLGGTASPLDKEACTGMTTGLGNGADVVRVGGTTTAVTTTNGVVGGGHTYKANTGVTDMGNLSTGCQETSPVIGMQFH